MDVGEFEVCGEKHLKKKLNGGGVEHFVQRIGSWFLQKKKNEWSMCMDYSGKRCVIMDTLWSCKRRKEKMCDVLMELW